MCIHRSAPHRPDFTSRGAGRSIYWPSNSFSVIWNIHWNDNFLKIRTSYNSNSADEELRKIGGRTHRDGWRDVKYVHVAGRRIAKIDSRGVHYFHKSHLGSTTTVTSDDGSVEDSLAYMPYGELSKYGVAGIEPTKYKFTDQELDIGLYLWSPAVRSGSWSLRQPGFDHPGCV